MDLKIRLNRVIGVLIANLFILIVHFALLLTKISSILITMAIVAFTLINIIRFFYLIIAYRTVIIYCWLKPRLSMSKINPSTFYYRMISPWSKKDLVIKDPKATYENNHLPIATYRSAENTLLRQEENIIKKYQDSIDGGSYSKYELFSIATQYNEDLKDVQEKIKLVSAAILRLEKKNPENFINLK
jgi:hypothetical protein